MTSDDDVNLISPCSSSMCIYISFFLFGSSPTHSFSDTKRIEIAINMKSSLLSVFLIFLLLADTSHSLGLRSLFSNILKGLKSKSKSDIIKDLPDVAEKIIDEFSSGNEERSASYDGEKIDGLNLIKRYLSDYGYLESSGPYNDTLDHGTESAIKAYQQFFNLNVTGQLNIQTLQLIMLPRCGSPDINFDSSFIGSDVSWPKAGNRWFPKTTRNLNYFLGSEIPRSTTNVFRTAFARWANATTVLNITETKNSDEADITVDFYILNSSAVGNEVVGGAVIRLRNGSDVKIGELILDGGLHWVPPAKNDTTLSWKEGVYDLETAVMHQIGHLLGLDHSNKTDSVMYPAILTNRQRKVQLSDDDKGAILKYYTTTATAATNSITNSGHGGAFTLFGSSWGLIITTLSLGLACMLLLY